MHQEHRASSRGRFAHALLAVVAASGAATLVAACHEGVDVEDELPLFAATTRLDPSSGAPGRSWSHASLEALAAMGPYGFATRDLVLVDATRATPPNRSYPGSPARTLPTRVYYPALPASHLREQPVPVAGGARFPLVAYAHGFTSRGEPARHMAEYLATHGYIVAAPLFPLSRGDAPGGPTVADVSRQPGDLAFVLKAITSLGGEHRDLAAAADGSRQGLVGFSAGGLTALLAVYHPALHIDGIDAAVVEAPVSCFLGQPVYQRALPVLMLAGTADELVPREGPERAFQLAPSPVVLAELLGGTHSGFSNTERPAVTNTDVLECERLLSSDPTQDDLILQQSIEQGAGPGAFDDAICGDLCSVRLPQTMGARRQDQIARAATLAHFEATLKGRSEAAVFRDVKLDQLPDVVVQIKP